MVKPIARRILAFYSIYGIQEDAIWYKDDACKWSGLKQPDGRFVQQVKDRTECFDDHFHIGDRIVTDDMFGIG